MHRHKLTHFRRPPGAIGTNVKKQMPPKEFMVCAQPGCDFRAKSASVMKNHLANRHNIGVTWYYCDVPGCLYKAKKASNQQRHKRTVHNSGAKWSYCDVCPFRTKQIGEVQRHRRKVRDDAAATSQENAELGAHRCLSPAFVRNNASFATRFARRVLNFAAFLMSCNCPFDSLRSSQAHGLDVEAYEPPMDYTAKRLHEEKTYKEGLKIEAIARALREEEAKEEKRMAELREELR